MRDRFLSSQSPLQTREAALFPTDSSLESKHLPVAGSRGKDHAAIESTMLATSALEIAQRLL